MSLGRRFSEDENAVSARCFLRLQNNRERVARQIPRKKSPAKFLVFNQNRRAVLVPPQKEASRISVTKQTQQQFDRDQYCEWQQESSQSEGKPSSRSERPLVC